jgi:transposase
VGEDHGVRVIEAHVNTLDVTALGFDKAITKETGRKPYHPGDLLKLYLYGYLNRVSTSRRLERECQRNVEVMWLLRRLRPDFKTIADFRKDNGEAIRRVCSAFIEFCRGARLRANPALMDRCMSIAERPFAVLKHLMAFRRFSCRGLAGSAN